MSTENQLAVLPTKETALQVFQTANGLDPYLDNVRLVIDEFLKSPPDMKTSKGRDAYRSMAAKVAGFKSKIETIGKEQSAIQKEIPKKIDAERRRVWDLLESWQKEVRRPLTEWEEAEASRVAGHERRIEELRTLDTEGRSAAEIASAICLIEEVEIGADWDEFEAEAHRVKASSLATLREVLAVREKHEAELAAIAKFQAEQAQREQKEREERIAREAAEQAQREAEQRAQAERDAAAKREADAKAAAEQRELQLKLEAEQSARRELEAKQRAEQAERDAEAKAQAAAAAERQRQADEQARIEAEAKAREADKAHKAAINRAALEAFVAGGMTEECAKQAVTLIAKRQIPNVSIAY